MQNCMYGGTEDRGANFKLYEDLRLEGGSVPLTPALFKGQLYYFLWIQFPFSFSLIFSLFIVCLDLACDGFCFFQAEMFYFYVVRFNSLFFYGFWIWVIVFPISRLSKNYLVFYSSFPLWFHFFHLNLWPFQMYPGLYVWSIVIRSCTCLGI